MKKVILRFIAIIWVIIASFIIFIPYTFYLISFDFRSCDKIYNWAYKWSIKQFENN